MKAIKTIIAHTLLFVTLMSIIVLQLAGCSQNKTEIDALQKRIEELENAQQLSSRQPPSPEPTLAPMQDKIINENIILHDGLYTIADFEDNENFSVIGRYFTVVGNEMFTTGKKVYSDIEDAPEFDVQYSYRYIIEENVLKLVLTQEKSSMRLSGDGDEAFFTIEKKSDKSFFFEGIQYTFDESAVIFNDSCISSILNMKNTANELHLEITLTDEAVEKIKNSSNPDANLSDIYIGDNQLYETIYNITRSAISSSDHMTMTGSSLGVSPVNNGVYTINFAVKNNDMTDSDIKGIISRFFDEFDTYKYRTPDFGYDF
jgi:hypothetical protein